MVETFVGDEQSPTEQITGTLVSARGIELKGPWGHVFGPLDLDIEAGGVTVIAGQTGAARTALLMALCGRMRLTRGSLTVLGFRDNPNKVFTRSAIACFDELDGVSPSVTVQDLVTEQLRWTSPWYKLVPRVTEQGVADMCADVFGDIPLPTLHAFVDDLPELQQMLLRVAVANTRRPPLLVVGRIDRIADDAERFEMLERLVALGERQSIITADVNPLPPGCGVGAVVDMHGLLGAGDIGVMTEGR
ncbi:ATP-binding cassette domain-containing protein [Prescottella defluvii]|uniref:ATP-binding cassette domain-containing protein n=1 Tax=Prescottella defluvii TaxID=1323361 RepID=UPI001E50BB92|nr:ATP-binding cassette domain-containing protein [Prescottella defluvii]